MRNKILTYLLALAAIALGLISCQREDPNGDGSATDVTISVILPESPAAKSLENPGDGTLVNRCILEIYEEGALYGERMYADVESMSAQFSTRLITGRTYSFVFWADYAEGSEADGFSDVYYNTEQGLTDIVLNEDAYLNNTDETDAFYGSFEQRIVNGGELNFTLNRPSGQVNLFTLDLASIPSNVNLANVVAKVNFDEVPAGFNALEGEISAERISVKPASFVVPVNFPQAGETPAAEAQISFDYIFASPEENSTLVNFTLELEENGKEVCADYYADNIPVRRNYRTNVKANFLTKGVDIFVEMDPIFDEEGEEPGPDPEPEQPTAVTIEEFLDAEVSTDTWYQLTGTITEIENETYGNLTIQDETGSVYIYGLTATKQNNGNDRSFNELGLKVNDILTLATLRGEFEGTPQGGGSDQPAYYISHESGEEPVIPEGDPTALMITEYSEGSGYNKFLEITNISDKEIDLSAYILHLYTNGAADDVKEAQLSGTLAAGASKVYKNSQADATLPDGVTAEDLNTIVNFNGNDPIAIICNGEIADVIGTIGSSDNFGQDVTLRRLSSVTAPSATYNTEEWETLDMTDLSGFGSHTVGEEGVIYFAINAEGEYYGTSNSSNANYKVAFTDGQGSEYVFDIYGAEWTEGGDIGLPEGTYALSGTADQYNTFYAANSYCTNVFEEVYNQSFTEGTLNVKRSGSQYEITGEFVIGDKEHSLTYYGNIGLEDQSGPVTPPAGFEGNVTIESPKAYLSYRAVKGNMYSFRLEINGFNTGGYNAYLDIVAPVDENGHITNGTYTSSETPDAYTLVVGENRSYCNYTDENYMQTIAMITSGTVTFSDSGVEVNVTVEGGSTVTSTYTGTIDYNYMIENSPRYPSAGSNVEGDVDATYSGDVNAYGNLYADCWHITIAPTYTNEGPALYVDLVTGKSAEEGLGGTYTCSDGGEAMTFLPGTSYVNGSDFDNWGAVYYDCKAAMHTGTYATINGGTITITEHSFEVVNEWGDMECVCDIELNGTDPNGNNIHVVYENIKISAYSNGSSLYYNL